MDSAAFFVSVTGAATRWLSHGIVYASGVVSYSLYLWHYFLRLVLEIALDYRITERVLAERVAYVIGTLILGPLWSLASYKLVEMPARHWLSGRKKGKPVGGAPGILLAEPIRTKDGMLEVAEK